MTLDEALRYGALLSLGIALFSVVFAVLSHRRQVNASIYLNLTDRLYNLYRSLPTEVRVAQLVGKEVAHTDHEDAAVIVLDFLHLMNAAFTLYRTGYFSGRLWKALSAEAQRGLRLPVFIKEWPRAKAEFSSSPKFIKYVELVQSGS